MTELFEKQRLVAETGRMLLVGKLVARTWGNTSARVDGESFVISPSGLDYLQTQPEDVPVVQIKELTWEGKRKPSSEKGIHAAAYAAFDDVNFVIHTHQTYASALSLGGFDNDRMAPEEKAMLGEVITAAYGLPGTKDLKKKVTKAFKRGARVVLMAHHGALICGTDRDDAFRKALLLEAVCKRQIRGMDVNRPATIQFAELGIPLYAQLDDMAQMLGKKVPVVTKRQATMNKLMDQGALVVRGKGIAVYDADPQEKAALEVLMDKAAVCALHTRGLGIKKRLSDADVLLMHTVYQLKYSKKKNG